MTAAESAARDRSAIAGGVPSRALMQRAGAAVAGEIALRFRDRLSAGVLVLAGPGNNGGDAWVVARGLAAAGVRTRVLEPIEAKTDDARAERALALSAIGSETGEPSGPEGGEAVIVDGLLGTGSSGAPRGPLGQLIEAVRSVTSRGAAIVSIDLPSGLDASSGAAEGAVVDADLTLTFGTVKRGHLVNRDVCGRIAVLDIGLGEHAALDDAAPRLVDELWVASRVPRIPATAHKGTRKKIAIVGGASGMAGASVLAARAALRSGVGMVKLVVADASLPIVQETEPAALATRWPRETEAAMHEIVTWADAVIIGPGLGRDGASRAVLELLLRAWRGPTLLDADALTLFEGNATGLAQLLGGRPALITPHFAEFARLSGLSIGTVSEARYDVGRELAAKLQAAVLLKGTPTIVTAPDGRRLVSAAGTPVLATAGSGDVLSGLAGTLLAQLGDPLEAGAVAAWVHGRAAERATAGERIARGVNLDDIVGELRTAWAFDDRPMRYPVLAELPDAAAKRGHDWTN